jgi:hypothetical protein
MKAILFTQEDTEGFDALQQKIHLHLMAKENHKYSASCWADSATAIVHEEQLCMPIDEAEPRYSYILEVLIQEEIDSIQDINLE